MFRSVIGICAGLLFELGGCVAVCQYKHKLALVLALVGLLIVFVSLMLAPPV